MQVSQVGVYEKGKSSEVKRNTMQYLDSNFVGEQHAIVSPKFKLLLTLFFVFPRHP